MDLLNSIYRFLNYITYSLLFQLGLNYLITRQGDINSLQFLTTLICENVECFVCNIVLGKGSV